MVNNTSKNSEILLFGDNKNISTALNNLLKSQGFILTIEQLPILEEDLEKSILNISETHKNKEIIVIAENYKLKFISELFNKFGINSLHIYPYDLYSRNNLKIHKDNIIRIDNTKPRFDRLEVYITYFCNLKCKGCSAGSNITDEKWYLPTQEFTQYLKKLKELFWGVNVLRIMGGEPLTNPAFLEYVDIARHIFPDCDIRIVTNGLLLKNLNEEQFNTLRNSFCKIDLTNYPPTQKNIKIIKEYLNNKNIPYNIGPPIYFFFKKSLVKPLKEKEIENVFNNCKFNVCHTLRDGYLGVCGNALGNEYDFLKNKFNYDRQLSDKDRINILTTNMSGWEIFTKFKKPIDNCKFCHLGMIPFLWKCNHSKNITINDWLVEDTFINMKIWTFLWKLALPFIDKLFEIYRKVRR